MARTFTTLAATCALACLAIATASADPGDERPDGPPRGRPHSGRPDGERGRGGFGHRRGGPPLIPLMKALDTDEDGEISTAEIENAAVSLKTLDKNEDGKLTHEELRPQFAFRGGPEGRHGRGGPPPEGRRGERPGRRGPGGDDRRGPPEGHAHGPGHGGPGVLIDRIMTLDENDDEQLSKDEFLKLFTKADRDEDGFVTPDEIEQMLREHHRKHGGPRGVHGRGPHGKGPREGRGPRDGGDAESDRPDRPE